MGVYIRGMEMPKDGVYWCEIGVAGDIATITIHGEDRKSFPLAPVPPHGDLINRDALGWISVKERYPFAEYGESDSVLTVDTLGSMRVAYFDGGNWCEPSGNCITNVRKFPITHWMPLPSPPEVEEK